MRIFIIIVSLAFLSAADNTDNGLHSNYYPAPGSSVVSIIDYGASSESEDNTEAFREAFKAGDSIFVPKGNFAYKIQGKLMVPAGKTLIFENGGVLDITGIINGYDTFIQAGNFKIFTPGSKFSGTYRADTLFCDWFGTVGNGLADDFEALNRFFEMTDHFQFVSLKFGKNKKYLLSKEIELKINKSFIINGNGSTLIRSYKDISEDNSTILSFSGVSKMRKVVNQDLRTGSDLIVLDNTIGIKAGMGFTLYSNELYGIESIGDKSVHHHYKGLIGKVLKVVDAFTIQLADKIPYHFDAAQIKRLDFYDIFPITVNNLNFSLLEASGTVKVDELKLKNVFDINIQDCNFIPNGYTAISASGVYNSIIKNIYIEGPKAGNQDYLGVYGIVPSLNVNVIYDNIYARAITHGIAFTKEPSFSVKVINSNLKAKNLHANGFDSHSSFLVSIENCEIWGAQGNYGTFVFTNCKMHNSNSASHIWNERQSGAAGRLNVTFKDCEFIFSEKESTNIIYMQSPIDSSNTYLVEHCKIKLPNNPEAFTYMINRRKNVNPSAKIKAVTFKDCSFYGSAKLYFPRNSKDTVACTHRGTFVFQNNLYGNLIMLQPNTNLFGEWLIEGNKPLGPESNFQISIQNTDANFNFNKNELAGSPFKIQQNSGKLIFRNNSINNTGKNIFSKNENLVFQNNSYPGNVIIEKSANK